jgi:hypothetical protein
VGGTVLCVGSKRPVAVSVLNRYGARFKLLTLVPIHRSVVTGSSDYMVALKNNNEQGLSNVLLIVHRSISVQ